MSVDVYPLNILGGAAGGSPPVTRVLDAFNRGTLNPATGSLLWQPVTMIILPTTAPIAGSTAFCGAQVDAANGLILSSFGQSNPATNYPIWMPCLGFTFSLVNGLTQYAQCTFIGFGTATAGDAGPAVMVADNGMAGASPCYCLVFDRTTGQPRVNKLSVASNALVAVLLGAGPYAATVLGDVWRISCQVGSPNTIRVSKNGTVIDTFTDATVTTGLPGFCIPACGLTAGVAAQIQVRNFDGGLGL